MTTETRPSERRKFRATCILTFVAVLLALSFFAVTEASAQGADMVVLQPDVVTGEFRAKVATNTDDQRLSRVCLYRIDSNSPDPEAEVTCQPAILGRAPNLVESPDGSLPGLIFEIPFNTVLVAGQDQLFTARSFGDIGGGVEISSVNATNSAFIPSAIGPPMFIIRAPAL